MQLSADIPQEKDWDWSDNPPPSSGWDDAHLGHDKFIGKSLEEMLPYFQTCPISVYEFLSFMPTIPFRYYVMAFKTLFLSEQHLLDTIKEGEAELVASCFLLIIERKLEMCPKLIMPIMDELMPAIEFVASHQDLLDEGSGNRSFGSFPDRVKKIKERYAHFSTTNEF